MDDESLVRLESKIDRLLALIEKFEPLLNRLLRGGGIFGRTR